MAPDLSNEAARRFIEAAQQDSQAAWRHFEPIQPVVDSTVKKWAQSYERLMETSGMALDDVIQEIRLRLFRSPPTRPEPGKEARTLRRWVAVATTNLLKDLARNRSRHWQPLQDEHELTADGRAEGQRRARDQLSDIRRVLREHYEKGLRVFDLDCTKPDLTDSERASLLDWTVDNVQQVRCRARQVLSLHGIRLERGRGRWR